MAKKELSKRFRQKIEEHSDILNFCKRFGYNLDPNIESCYKLIKDSSDVHLFIRKSCFHGDYSDTTCTHDSQKCPECVYDKETPFFVDYMEKYFDDSKNLLIVMMTHTIFLEDPGCIFAIDKMYQQLERINNRPYGDNSEFDAIFMAQYIGFKESDIKLITEGTCSCGHDGCGLCTFPFMDIIHTTYNKNIKGYVHDLFDSNETDTLINGFGKLD